MSDRIVCRTEAEAEPMRQEGGSACREYRLKCCKAAGAIGALLADSHRLDPSEWLYDASRTAPGMLSQEVPPMNVYHFTDRVRGLVRAARSLAMREGHQQFSTPHILRVLLDDTEGLAGGLIDRAGGDSRAIRLAADEALDRLPKASGAGANHIYLAPEASRAFTAAQRAAQRAGDTFVTAERLLLALATDRDTGKILASGGVSRENLKLAIGALRKGRAAENASPSVAVTR